MKLQSQFDPSAASPTILCVDDEASGLYVRKMVLQSAGYSVLTADNGCLALDVFLSNPIDCVVLDYYMPGMDGGLVAERMRNLKPSVPIVLLSAYVSLPEATLRLVDAYVTKGQSPSVLLDRLRKLLQNGHGHPELQGDYVAFANSDRRYVEVTDGFCSLLGFTRSELLTMTIDDVAAPASVPELFADYIRTGEQKGSIVLRRKDGATIKAMYHARVYPDGCMVSRIEPIEN